MSDADESSRRPSDAAGADAAAAPDSAASIDPVLRKLRHDMMGRLNAIKLVATLLPMLERHEVVQYVDTVVKEADEMLRLLDVADRLPDPA